MTFFSERNVYIRVTVPLENFGRVKICVAIQKRKNGKTKNGKRKKTRTKKSGRIWGRKKVRKERRKKNNQAS